MRGWILSPGLPLALAVIGSFGLAYSWQVQNRELVHAYDDVTRLQRSQLVVENDEVWRDQWIIALSQEVVKDKPNEVWLAETAHQALEGVVRWQTHMRGACNRIIERIPGTTC